MNYDVVIGIEIHLELLTKTKMFAAAPVVFGQKPNTSVNEYVLGYPGAMPQVNKTGVIKAIQACHLLNMKIDSKLTFDRKHYNYHDLPKGWQITQYYRPLGIDGTIDIGSKIINIERLHIEEDTAKTIKKGNDLLIDYNRAGNPLIEVVTKPEFVSAQEVVDYVSTFSNLMLYAKISNAKMEQGSLRCDVNISLKEPGSKKLGDRVEIKNINSLSNIKKAINYEIKRQSSLLKSGKKIINETRFYNENDESTVKMRTKDSILDYRYIREVNIATIHLDKAFIDKATSSIKANYFDIKDKILNAGFNKQEVNNIIGNNNLIPYIKYWYNLKINTKLYFKVLTNQFSEIMANVKKPIISPKDYANFIENIEQDNLQAMIYKKILEEMIKSGCQYKVAFQKHNVKLNEDVDNLKSLINKFLTDELKETYLSRPNRVKKQVVGSIMKETKGKSNPVIIAKLLDEMLK